MAVFNVTGKRPVPFNASREIASAEEEQTDCCCLCGKPFCDGECDETDGGWWGVDDESHPAAPYLSCWEHPDLHPPTRHPATARLGDLPGFAKV